MEKTANDLASKCPCCGQVFYWHPRYDKILKRKKTFTEELKENIRKVTIQSKYSFPLCDSKIVQQFYNYIRSFNTYAQIISYIAGDRNNVQIKSLQASAENIVKAMKKTTSKCLQNWIDISDAIFRLYVNWMLQLVTSNEKLLERKFNGKNITQNPEENDSGHSHGILSNYTDSSSEIIELKTSQPVIKRIKGNDGDTKFEVIDLSVMFEEKNTVSLKCESNSMKNGCDGDTSTDQKVKEISQTEVEECLTGLDIVRRIKDTMINNQKSEVKRLLNIMIPFMRNEPHFTEAMQCPQLTSVTAIGVHEKDWKICKQGHLTSTLIHQNCYTCSAASSSKVSAESKEGVLWKTHFQPLTENSERDRYHQGKGNKMGAQQGRNKRNKSNKIWMSETFEKDTKQTNIQEVRTHVQGSNHPSGNVTLLDYIHTNTVGTNRGNSRGRGRGRGKKNQQTYEVAGRPFQTHPAGYQGYNTDFNSSVGRPKGGNSSSNFMQSNFGRSTENRGTSHNGIWQRNTVPHYEQVVSHHDPVAGHNGIWQRNIVPHHEQVAGTFGINMQQSTIYNEPNENFKPFKGGFGRGGQRGRGRRGRRGGRGERN